MNNINTAYWCNLNLRDPWLLHGDTSDESQLYAQACKHVIQAITHDSFCCNTHIKGYSRCYSIFMLLSMRLIKILKARIISTAGHKG